MSGGKDSLVERGFKKEPPTKAGAGEAVLLGALAQGVNVSMGAYLFVVCSLRDVLKKYFLGSSTHSPLLIEASPT